MSCLNCIIKNHGESDYSYKIEHMNKERMEQKRTLPMVLKVTDAAAYMLELMNEENGTETST